MTLDLSDIGHMRFSGRQGFQNILYLGLQGAYQCLLKQDIEKATEIQKFQNNKPIALIFGHEVNGISQEIIDTCDEVIEIPQYGTKHSLNISVCAGIVMWKIAEMY